MTEEAPVEIHSPTPSEQGILFTEVANSVDVDITPLLTHPDRQRSRKLLESCLREINYLMAPPIQIDQSSQEWQQYVPQPTTESQEISYIGIDNPTRPEDEELPRKLPRKANLDQSPKDEISWDFTPPPPDLDSKTTILDRQSQPRSSAKSAFTQKSEGPRTFQHIHTLRSHLSPVRALVACNSSSTMSDETAFISAGDDSTVKFWRVNRIGPNPKKKGNFDILPQITFRGHTGMVTCLAEAAGSIWSGGSDGGIRGWKVPSPSRDAYGSSGIPTHFCTYDSRRWGCFGVGGTYELYLESCCSWDSATSFSFCCGGYNRQDLGYSNQFPVSITRKFQTWRKG